jgi:hypothetical protein
MEYLTWKKSNGEQRERAQSTALSGPLACNVRADLREIHEHNLHRRYRRRTARIKRGLLRHWQEQALDSRVNVVHHDRSLNKWLPVRVLCHLYCREQAGIEE